MMRRYVRTTEPQPYDSVLFCPLCGLELHVTRRSEVPWTVFSDVAERAAHAHMAAKHRFRYWLWRGLRWSWLMGGINL